MLGCWGDGLLFPDQEKAPPKRAKKDPRLARGLSLDADERDERALKPTGGLTIQQPSIPAKHYGEAVVPQFDIGLGLRAYRI